jgi:hypothetical protein
VGEAERVYAREGQHEAGGRGFASGAGALIEVEVRNRLRFGQVVHRRLIEVEIGLGVEGEFRLGRSSGWGGGWRGGGQTEVGKNASVGSAAVMKAMMRTRVFSQPVWHTLDGWASRQNWIL